MKDGNSHRQEMSKLVSLASLIIEAGFCFSHSERIILLFLYVIKLCHHVIIVNMPLYFT